MTPVQSNVSLVTGHHFNLVMMHTLYLIHILLSISASKWPIEHQEDLVFGYKNIKTIKNIFIPKGAVYAKVRKKVGDEEQIYHLLGLHLFVS